MFAVNQLACVALLSIFPVSGANAGGDQGPVTAQEPGLAHPDAYLPCDTWVALPDATQSGTTILAKNSDRPLFDCQPLLFHPRAQWAPESKIDLGRLTIPQVAETYATLGSSPYWCWGYEEGINEFGVAIGNEGIWSKVLVADLEAAAAGEGPEVGPTGMDLLRLGLERGKTAREALQVITDLLEEHGQFGSGIPTLPAALGAYENSFLIADPKEAWVLETCGSRWIARKFSEGTTSISNSHSIRGEWDLCSPDLSDFAVEMGWWSSETAGPLNFAAAFEDDTAAGVGRTYRAQARAQCSASLLEGKTGDIDTWWMMRIARDRSSTPSIDLDQTASSCVAVLPGADEGLPVFWWCPGTPSNGCYVPFFVHGSALPAMVGVAGTAGREIAAPSQVDADAFSVESYWWLFRDLCDQSRLDYAERNPVIRAEFDRLEQEFAAALPGIVEEAVALRKSGKNTEAAAILGAFSALCVERAVEKVNELRERFQTDKRDVPAKFSALVGEYQATINRDRVEVLVQEERLAVEIPNQGVFQLQEPDATGRRPFVLTDQAAVSFVRDDFGAVTGMVIHQSGLDFELVRAGVVLPPEVPIAKLQRYLGEYFWESEAISVMVFVQNNRLAIDWPERMIFELRPPDGDGAWQFRLGDTSAVRFDEDPSGEIGSMTYLRDGEVEEVLFRVSSSEGSG